jgi:hypothetical protein
VRRLDAALLGGGLTPPLVRRSQPALAYVKPQAAAERRQAGALQRVHEYPLPAAAQEESALGRVDISVDSEEDFCANLNVSWRANVTVPHPEGWTGDIDVKGSSASCVCTDVVEVVPVPKIEEFGADLYGYCFRNARVFDQTEVVIVKAKTS